MVEKTENNFRFPGQYYIEETGLYYNWNRWYKEEVGRYVKRDIFHFSNNKYIYVSNQPINRKDLNGLVDCEIVYELIVDISCELLIEPLCIYACYISGIPKHMCHRLCFITIVQKCGMISHYICKLYCKSEPEDKDKKKPDKPRNKCKNV